MNDLQYKVLDYLYQKGRHKTLDVEEIYDSQYDDFNEHAMVAIGKTITLTRKEFMQIMTEINEVLKLYLSQKECNVALTHYLIKLLSDCVVLKQDIDRSKAIDNIYYLGTAVFLDKDITAKVVSYVQSRLYKQFEMEESFREKTMRKMKNRTLISAYKKSLF